MEQNGEGRSPDLRSRAARISQIAEREKQESARKDKTAHKEDSIFDRDYEHDTDEQLLKAQRTRDEKTREAFHKLLIIGLKVAGVAFIALFASRFWHLVAPNEPVNLFGLCNIVSDGEPCVVLYWLSEQQLQEIDRLLFSGAIGGLISRYLAPIITNGNGKG